jgi:hypothetical protein
MSEKYQPWWAKHKASAWPKPFHERLFSSIKNLNRKLIMSKLLYTSASPSGERSASIGVANKFIIFVAPTLAKADAVETERSRPSGWPLPSNLDEGRNS